MEFLLWIIIVILLIGFGFAPIVLIIAAMAAVYFVLVILGKIVVFFGVCFYLIFIEPKRAHPKIRIEEVKEVKRFPKEVKEYNEKVDKITNSILILGLLSIVFFSVLITAAG